MIQAYGVGNNERHDVFWGGLPGRVYNLNPYNGPP